MRLFPVVLIIVFCGGCLQTHQLRDLDTDGALLFVDSDIPDALFADFNRTVFDDVERDVYPVLRENEKQKNTTLGSFELRHAEGPKTPLHTLLDSVLVTYDMSAHVIETSTQHVLRETGLRLTDDAEIADYILYLDVKDYGLGADDWESPLFFEIHAELSLFSEKEKDVLWSGEVLDIVKVPGALIQQNIPETHLSAPAQMNMLTYEQVKDVLYGLGHYTGGQLVKGLIQEYHESQQVEKAILVAE